MRQELVFASIRQGDISAADGWKLLSPLVDTDDLGVATRVCESLRSWAWKALDRRRRDAEIREWIDLLNRVEAFLASKFGNLAAKVEVLAELLHESMAVADLAEPAAVLEKKHVRGILRALARREGEWLSRTVLMEEVELRPANTTRLMSLLLDVSWVEQKVVGREASYRILPEGLQHVRTAELSEIQAAEAGTSELDMKKERRLFWKSLKLHARIATQTPFWELKMPTHGQAKAAWEAEQVELLSLIDTDNNWAAIEDNYREYSLPIPIRSKDLAA